MLLLDPVDNNNSHHVVGIPSDFKTKSQPTTAVSNFEGTVILNHTHIYFDPTHLLITPLADLPPPKPKRPTRDILDKLKF